MEVKGRSKQEWERMYDALLVERDALRGQLDELLAGDDDEPGDDEPAPTPAPVVGPSKVLEPVIKDITFSAAEPKQEAAQPIPLADVYAPSEVKPEARPSIDRQLRDGGPAFQAQLVEQYRRERLVR